MTENIFIIASGTGGHVIPARNISNMLIKKKYNVIWIGTSTGIENRLVNNKNIIIKHINFRMYKMNIFDVHIKNGEVIDGTGAPKFKSDIVIDKGKIIGVFHAENGDVRDPSENHFYDFVYKFIEIIKIFNIINTNSSFCSYGNIASIHHFI